MKDNGIGMSKEYLPHIFEEFTREHSSTESHITGTGLGLPIVKSLVNLMGGTIDVESELGAGTITTICLTFELPTEEQLAAHQHKDEILEQSLQTLSEKRVLLAEDNDLNAEIVLTVLEENGIHAEHVKDGALCLKAVQNAPEDYYNVILMDIQMPNMNGYQAAEAIRALPGKRGEIPIVAMTANAFEEDRRKALESGMNAISRNPLTFRFFSKHFPGFHDLYRSRCAVADAFISRFSADPGFWRSARISVLRSPGICADPAVC